MSVRCRVCAAELPDEEVLALHLGRLHVAELTPDERAAYEEAASKEADTMLVVRRHVKGTLFTLPLLLSYLLIVLLGFQDSAVSATLALLLFPGVLVFSGLAYYLAYTHEREHQFDAFAEAREDNDP